MYQTLCNWGNWPFVNFILIMCTMFVVGYLLYKISSIATKVQDKVDIIDLRISKAHQDALALFVDRLSPPKHSKE